MKPAVTKCNQSDDVDVLTARQRAAVERLASGELEPVLCDDLGISRQTLWRWKRSPRFMSALAEAQHEMAERIRGRLFSAAMQAVDTLEGILIHSQDEALKLRAASVILSRLPGPVEPPTLTQMTKSLYARREVDCYVRSEFRELENFAEDK